MNKPVILEIAKALGFSVTWPIWLLVKMIKFAWDMGAEDQWRVSHGQAPEWSDLAENIFKKE